MASPAPIRTLDELERVIAGTLESRVRLPCSRTEVDRPKITESRSERIVFIRPRELSSAIRSEPPKTTAQVPVATFRHRDSVRHPAYGVGRVLKDGTLKFLHSQGLWDEDVVIRFACFTKVVSARLAGLRRILD
jgi:hypothetical protein